MVMSATFGQELKLILNCFLIDSSLNKDMISKQKVI